MRSFRYGGQAVIEGVMMRGASSMAVAVRRPDGTLAIKTEALKGFYLSRLRSLPLARGIVILAETLTLGVKTLIFSADVSLEKEEVQMTPKAWAVMLASALSLVVAIFFLTPLLVVHAIDYYIGSPVTSNIIEGVIRLAFLLLYLKGISFIPDIKRVFAYHGAEHKTINAYEAGDALTVEEVRKYSTAHTRCGTGFLLVVMLVSIFVFALIAQFPLEWRLASRVILLPLIAAISYELVRFSADHFGNPIVGAIFWPSLALQAFTTREPDDDQIRVAITALEKVLEADGVLVPAGALAAVGAEASRAS